MMIMRLVIPPSPCATYVPPYRLPPLLAPSSLRSRHWRDVGSFILGPPRRLPPPYPPPLAGEGRVGASRHVDSTSRRPAPETGPQYRRSERPAPGRVRSMP